MGRSKMMKVVQATSELVLALYVRVSTDRQADEGYSIEIQLEKLNAYAKTFSGVREVRHYIDDGYSGASLDRPQMGKLITDIEAGEITHVIVVKLDRLSRSQKDTLHLIEDILIPHNVAFISILESFNTDSAFGRAMVGILSVFAQLERENIFERTRGGMRKRVEDGYWPGGGRVPFGYNYDSHLGILVPNADAPKVRYIYQRYLDGASLQAIADELDLKYEKLVYNILTRKSNAGFITYNGEEFLGRHEAIIPLELYEKAMELFEARSNHKLVCKTPHLLTGIVRCGRCGAKMRYLKWGKAGYKLVCYSQQKSKPYLVRDPDCDNPSPWAEDVENGVIDTLFTVSKEHLEAAKQTANSMDPTILLNEKKAKLETKLRRLYDLYGEGGDDVLLTSIRETKDLLSELNVSIGQIDKQSHEKLRRAALNTVEHLENIRDTWSEMSTQEQRMVLASVIESITINGEYTDIRLKFGLNEVTG